MLHLLEKLKLYTKLLLERVHKAPISIQFKIYLWSFVDYQHLQKYFYNWSITMNYYFIYKINIRGNFIWKVPWSGHILEILGTVRYSPERALFFWKKDTKNFTPSPLLHPYFEVFCFEIKLCIIFTKRANVQ